MFRRRSISCPSRTDGEPTDTLSLSPSNAYKGREGTVKNVLDRRGSRRGKDAGCPERIPHDFRRSTVRNLVRAGIPERVAMTLTGHKIRSVLERYSIVSQADLMDAAKRLDEAVSR